MSNFPRIDTSSQGYILILLGPITFSGKQVYPYLRFANEGDIEQVYSGNAALKNFHCQFFTSEDLNSKLSEMRNVNFVIPTMYSRQGVKYAEVLSSDTLYMTMQLKTYFLLNITDLKLWAKNILLSGQSSTQIEKKFLADDNYRASVQKKFKDLQQIVRGKGITKYRQLSKENLNPPQIKTSSSLKAVLSSAIENIQSSIKAAASGLFPSKNLLDRFSATDLTLNSSNSSMVAASLDISENPDGKKIDKNIWRNNSAAHIIFKANNTLNNPFLPVRAGVYSSNPALALFIPRYGYEIKFKLWRGGDTPDALRYVVFEIEKLDRGETHAEFLPHHHTNAFFRYYSPSDEFLSGVDLTFDTEVSFGQPFKQRADYVVLFPVDDPATSQINGSDEGAYNILLAPTKKYPSTQKFLCIAAKAFTSEKSRADNALKVFTKQQIKKALKREEKAGTNDNPLPLDWNTSKYPLYKKIDKSNEERELSLSFDRFEEAIASDAPMNTTPIPLQNTLLKITKRVYDIGVRTGNLSKKYHSAGLKIQTLLAWDGTRPISNTSSAPLAAYELIHDNFINVRSNDYSLHGKENWMSYVIREVNELKENEGLQKLWHLALDSSIYSKPDTAHDRYQINFITNNDPQNASLNRCFALVSGFGEDFGMQSYNTSATSQFFESVIKIHTLLVCQTMHYLMQAAAMQLEFYPSPVDPYMGYEQQLLPKMLLGFFPSANDVKEIQGLIKNEVAQNNEIFSDWSSSLYGGEWHRWTNAVFAHGGKTPTFRNWELEKLPWFAEMDSFLKEKAKTSHVIKELQEQSLRSFPQYFIQEMAREQFSAPQNYNGTTSIDDRLWEMDSVMFEFPNSFVKKHFPLYWKMYTGEISSEKYMKELYTVESALKPQTQPTPAAAVVNAEEIDVDSILAELDELNVDSILAELDELDPNLFDEPEANI